jgi:phosphoglucomutase/phosphomannomutase
VGSEMCIRDRSGTEPKIKMYFEVIGRPCHLEQISREKDNITGIRKELEKAFMLHCYKVLGVDFPERGFLLFWQLPLKDKLHYFDIEKEILNLKTIAERTERKAELYKLLDFLGADPVEKVDEAFRAKYEVGILEYLDLL